MRITDVRAIQPVCPDSPEDWRTSIGQILVAIDTDRGLTGYGMGGGGLAGVHVVETVLRDSLLGKDPEDVEDLWDLMYRNTLAFGRKGIAVMAISGVDLALWDLRGKAVDLPVCRLITDTPRMDLPVYRTVWGEISETMVRSYSAFKLHVERSDGGDQVEQVHHAVEWARERIGDRKLMIDAWMRWSVELTLDVARHIEPLGVDWIEEPISPDDLDGYRRLVSECPIPIAGGEHEFTAIGFEPLIQGKLHQVLQPDICWCGGMTEMLKIEKMAVANGLSVCPHRGAELWGLQAIAAFQDETYAETGRPWLSWLGGQPFSRDGRIAVPDRPGFGLRIDESEIEAVR